MLIALDYDKTFTLAPDEWVKTIELFKVSGHKFVCVTARPGIPENQELLGRTIGKYMPVIFCNHSCKWRVAKSYGFTPDIWIDDRPETIPFNTRQWRGKNFFDYPDIFMKEKCLDGVI